MTNRLDWSTMRRVGGMAKVVPKAHGARGCLPLFSLVGHHHLRYFLGHTEVGPVMALRYVMAGRTVTYNAWAVQEAPVDSPAGAEGVAAILDVLKARAEALGHA